MIPNALMKRIPFRRGAFPPVPPLLHFLITAALLIFIALGWSSSVTDMLGASASCSPSRVDGDTLFLQEELTQPRSTFAVRPHSCPTGWSGYITVFFQNSWSVAGVPAHAVQ